MSWPFCSVALYCPCNQMLQLSHWLQCPSQCPCSEAFPLPVLLSNYMWSSQALSGSDRWSWYILWTSSLSAFPWTHRSSYLLCPAEGICRSRWKGKPVSPCLLSEVNLFGHKAQSLERTEKNCVNEEKMIVRLLQFPYKYSQSVLTALRSTKLAPSTDVWSGVI